VPIVGQRAGVTDTGRKRRHNEDAYVVDPPLFAIADGMGGAQAGEIASQLAAAALEEGREGDHDGETRVVSLIQEANRRVHQRSLEDPHASGMGTTMTVALVGDGIVWIGHVGDSRAYLLRDGRLQQLTDDHSLVAELVRSGKVRADEAQMHPQRSVITRAVGTDPDVDVDTFPIEPRPGDVFLICSDGLTDMVDDATIRDTIERNRGDLDAAARALVGLANRSGGEDNITVVAFEIAEETVVAAAAEDDETQRLDAVADATAPDEEDTLSGIERVPAIDTMVVPVEELRTHPATPEPSRRWTARRVLAILLVVALLAAAAVLVAWGLDLL
jgi:PPM family protein phosphatase